MLQVIQQSKFFLVIQMTAAVILVFAPFVTMWIFTDFRWYQVLLGYLVFVAPALIGLALFYDLWPRFEMKKPGAPEKH